MALTQEEIRIKAGLDYSRVTAGLHAISGQVGRLAAEVPKKLGSILKTSVAGIAVSLVDELKPLGNMALDKLLGIGPNAIKRAEEQAKLLADAVNKASDSQGKLAAEKKRDEYERATLQKKIALLDKELAAEEERYTAQRKTSDELLKQKATLEAQIAALSEIAKQQEVIKGQMGQQFPVPTGPALQAGRDLRSARDKLSEVELGQLAADQGANEAEAKAIALRRQRDDLQLKVPVELPALQDTQPVPAPRSVFAGARNYEAYVKGRMRMHQANIDRINAFGKPQAAPAQPAAGEPGAKPLRVSIVEIEE